jgi:hypothetical protein
MSPLAKMLFIVCQITLIWIKNGYAEQFEWNFNNSVDVKNLKVIGATLEMNLPGSVIVRGSDTFFLVFPSRLNIPNDISYIEFRLRAPVTYLMGHLVLKTSGNRTFQEEFQLGAPGKFHVYRINIQRGNTTKDIIDSFAFVFGGGIEWVEFNHLRCYDPSFFELAAIYWADFWEVAYIKSATINFIESPHIGNIPFMNVLIGIFLFLLIFMLIWLRSLNTHSLLRYTSISFLVVGFFFSARMDYGWYMTWRLDKQYLSKKHLDERISIVEGTGAYEFAKAIKNIVPANEKLRVYGGNLSEKIKYYLLPLRVSDDSKYVAVYKDRLVSFDSFDKTLKINSTVIARNVTLVRAFQKDAFLFLAEPPR